MSLSSNGNVQNSIFAAQKNVQVKTLVKINNLIHRLNDNYRGPRGFEPRNGDEDKDPECFISVGKPKPVHFVKNIKRSTKLLIGKFSWRCYSFWQGMANATESPTYSDYKVDCLHDHVEHEIAVIINCALNVPVMLTAIIANAFVLIAILRTPNLHSPFMVFLCSLALSDLFVGLVVQPAFIAHLFSCTSLTLQVYSILSLSAGGVSLATITAISVDRFLALHYHLRYPEIMTIQRAVCVSTSIWSLCLLLSCLNLWSYENHLFAVGFGIAFCILLSSFSYIKIYRIARRHQCHIHAQQQATDHVRTEQNRYITQTARTALNTFIYFIFMLLFYLPVSMSALTRAIFPNIWNVTWSFSDSVAFMISAINPFLYCWRVHEIHTAVIKFLRSILFKQTDAN
ncbi:melanocyte-stimulating hormone receptor-like [Montipora capricornis]|uniref:melanocyte-stimulating hormone receptor-like n=1 Tax=Montipora capricornis TaxID=246305 RepID=UPI0035F14050